MDGRRHKNVLLVFLRFTTAITFYIAPITKGPFTSGCRSKRNTSAGMSQRLSQVIPGSPGEAIPGARSACRVSMVRLPGGQLHPDRMQGCGALCVCVHVFLRFCVNKNMFPTSQLKSLLQFVIYFIYTLLVFFISSIVSVL